MKRDDLTILIADTFAEVRVLNNSKGREYAGDEEALANFYNRAEQLDLDPQKVWAVFASKHYDAILAYIRTGKVLSEPIQGRVHDLILYLVLLLGLIKDAKADEGDVAALAGWESAYRDVVAQGTPAAASSTGAAGLFQMMPPVNTADTQFVDGELCEPVLPTLEQVREGRAA
jgi:hypothetical protein